MQLSSAEAEQRRLERERLRAEELERKRREDEVRRQLREQKLASLQRELAGIPAEFVVVRDEDDSGVAWSIKEGGSRYKSLKSVTRAAAAADGSAADSDDAPTDPAALASWESPRKRRVQTLEKQYVVGTHPLIRRAFDTIHQSLSPY